MIREPDTIDDDSQQQPASTTATSVTNSPQPASSTTSVTDSYYSILGDPQKVWFYFAPEDKK
jgi:hypothetical protein